MANPLVLCYHAVSPSWPAALSVTPLALEDQLRFLTRRGYLGTTFSEVALASDSAKVAAITFDDGFSSVMDLAAPILERHGFPGTVFVPTSFVGSPEPISWPGTDVWVGTEHEDELAPMDWGQLRHLADRGWEVGSHTCTHPRLTGTSDGALADELEQSKHECEAALARPCRSLAYPYGDHDQRVVEAAARAGYEAAGTLPATLHPVSPLRWPRVGVYHRDDRTRFALKSLGPSRRLRRHPIAHRLLSIPRQARR